MQFIIEQAQTSDIPGLQAVADASWRATYAPIFSPEFIDRWLQEAYGADALRSSLASDDSLFLVAKTGEQIVGYGQAGVGRGAQGFVLYRLYVDPVYWRQGIGARLLTNLEEWLKTQGATGYSCFVHSQNEVGKAFYGKLRFVHDPAHDHDDEWFMWKLL
jgi:diamine N-acetyltransferase